MRWRHRFHRQMASMQSDQDPVPPCLFMYATAVVLSEYLDMLIVEKR